MDIPGATLEPGRYLFHLVDPDSARQVLQVQSGDGKRVYAMFFTLPAERSEPSPEPEVRFFETAAGSPAAIRTVWYGGERTGRELIYPRDQATRIARVVNQPVLTTQASSVTAKETGSGDLTRISPTGQDTPVAANAQAAMPEGRSQQGNLDDSTAVDKAPRRATTTQPVETVARNESTRERLPETAGAVPAVVLLGFALMLGAGALRLWRTSRS